MLIGWLDPRDRLHLYPDGGKMGKYHTMILTRLMSFDDLKPHMSPRVGEDIRNDMGKFVRSGDMTEDELERIVDRSYESLYRRLRDGKIDGDHDLEEKLQENGWTKIRIDRKPGGISSISCKSPKRCHDTAKILDKELGGWQGMNTSRLWVDATVITDDKTWDIYVKTGRIPKRTDIGRTMSQFREENLHERAGTIKGWVNPKTGKTRFTRRMRPYHVEYIAQTPEFFGVKEKDMLDALEKQMDGWDSPDPAEDAKKELELLKTAKVDINYAIERLAMENGWYRVVGGEYGEISGIKVDDRTIGKILNIMEDKNVIGFGGAGTEEFIIYKYKKPNLDGTVDSDIVKVIPRASAARLMSGKPIGDKMSDIGRTMAMFR